jgi:hypothetical protein
MSDEPKKRSRAWIGWALLAVLVVYPLSAGPVTLSLYRAKIDDRVLGTPYAPIKWVMNNNDTFRRVFLTYLGLWVRHPLNPEAHRTHF